MDIPHLTKDIHFPITRAIPTSIDSSIVKKTFHFLTYRRKFEIMEDYFLYSPHLDTWVFLPKGFIFDGASVPKVLNGLYNPTGMLLLGAAPHDLGYRYEGLFLIDKDHELHFSTFSKKELDTVFNNFCAYESGMPKASGTATLGLSLFGFLGWRENRRKNCNLFDDFPELFVDDCLI